MSGIEIYVRHRSVGAMLNFHLSSRDRQALVHALTALPHDLLIGFSSKDIERVTTAMMSLVDRPRPRPEREAAPKNCPPPPLH